jgi:Pyruvate/2-oxoacid:ferredoxin oxidoreductase delta subunit
MKYGIYDIRKVAKDEEIVRCNNCSHYFYDDSTDERNNNSLKLFEDKEFGTEYKEFFKGCPVCTTDIYLTDIDLSLFLQQKICKMQCTQPNSDYMNDL